MTRNRTRLQIIVLAAVALALIAALAISALTPRTIREAAYDLNGISPVVRLINGGQVCEAPVEVAGSFRRLVFWSSGAGSKALVAVHAGRSVHSPTLALGILESAGAGAGENIVVLTQTVKPSPGMSVCVTARRGAVTLYGGLSQYLSNYSGPTYGAPVIMHFRPASTLWMQAWSARRQSLWQALPVAFGRMSLFRLSWIGPWTFWILLVGLLTGFPLLILAVRSALKADEEPTDKL